MVMEITGEPANSSQSLVMRGLSNNSGLGVMKVTSQDQRLDPLLALAPEERQAWVQSRTGLVVTAVISRSRGKSIAMVNGIIVGKGEVLTIASAGRVFPWRLSAFTPRGLVWEPVFNAKDEDGPSFIPLR